MPGLMRIVQVRPSGGNLRHRRRDVRNDLGRAREIVERVQRLEDRALDVARVVVGRRLRVESGFGDRKHHADRLRRIGPLGLGLRDATSATTSARQLRRRRSAAAAAMGARRQRRRSVRAHRTLCRGLAAFEIDVIVAPGVAVERVVFVADDPRLHEHVLVTIRVKVPRRVDGDELRHPLQDLRARGAVGHRPRLFVELVELGQLEAREVGESRVAAVEKAEEAEPFGRRADVAEEPHLQLAEPRRLEQVGELLVVEFDAEPDGVEASFPQLVVLAVERARPRRRSSA